MRDGIKTIRSSPHPGPRCVSHHREFRKSRNARSWETRIARTYGLTAEQYWEIYEYQGGRCYICQRATGARKRLSVDHCHEKNYVRGLLCNPCNKYVLGHLRDDPEALDRAAGYLREPPAVEAVGVIFCPDT